MLQNILIKRLGIISVKTNVKVWKRNKIIFLSELVNLGYEIKNPELFNDSILEDYKETVNTLKEIKWWNVDYVQLFQWFPENTPNDNEYFKRRILGFIDNNLWLFDEWKTLENWLKIPEWLFDLKEFWADPITQFQDEKLFKKWIQRQKSKKSDSHTEWIKLEFITEQEAINKILNYMQNILYSKSSIKESLKNEIEFLINYFGFDKIDFNKIVFKETKSYLMKYLWKTEEFEILKNLISTPTDILRLFASITNTDISLSHNIKFPKFRRTQRRFILQTLENFKNPLEDINTYKNLWIDLWNYLHPWEYKKKYPKTFKVFDIIRNSKVETFNSKIEKYLRNRNVDELLKILSKRPWIFARKLHEILEKSWDFYKDVLIEFKKIVNKIEIKNLLVMKSYFATIENSEYRTIINKRWKIRVIDNKQNRLKEKVINELILILKEAILEKLSEKKDSWEWKKIYVENWLEKITIPLSLRKASDWVFSVWRWSRIKIDLTKILRLFVYWKQTEKTTDLDLSLIKFDENLEIIWHVSYTKIKSSGVVHSWDIQSAPNWASEFIDIDLDYFDKSLLDKFLKKPKVKYLVPQIYRFTWEKFSDMTTYAWWMIRNEINSNYKTFDIKTVQNKFDVAGSWSYVIPMIVDIENSEIIFTDLYMNASENQNRVEWAYLDIATVSSEVLKMVETKPNMKELATYNIKARKWEIVEDKNDANIVFWFEEWDYNMKNSEKILNDLI